jgi:anti-anti-sigma factor
VRKCQLRDSGLDIPDIEFVNYESYPTTVSKEGRQMSEFTISRLDGGSGLKLVGELDVATASRLTEALRGNEDVGELVLDLSELTFLDSCGMRALLDLARARNGNGPVVILDPSRAVARLLEIIGVEEHPGMELRATQAVA